MQFSVYAIIDPRNCQVFYIGQTSDFALRCRQHEEGGDTIAGLLIREITASGQKPIFALLEHCPTKRRALMAEVFWIDLFTSRGASLANAQAFEGYAARAQKKQSMQTPAEPELMEGLEALANGRPLREGRRWSRKEDAMMRRLLQEGMSVYEVADRLDRSVGAIDERKRRPSTGRQRLTNARVLDIA
jgi:predicted GIY-YIG superfamily endonuclease